MLAFVRDANQGAGRISGEAVRWGRGGGCGPATSGATMSQPGRRVVDRCTSPPGGGVKIGSGAAAATGSGAGSSTAARRRPARARAPRRAQARAATGSGALLDRLGGLGDHWLGRGRLGCGLDLRDGGRASAGWRPRLGPPGPRTRPAGTPRARGRARAPRARRPATRGRPRRGSPAAPRPGPSPTPRLRPAHRPRSPPQGRPPLRGRQQRGERTRRAPPAPRPHPRPAG